MIVLDTNVISSLMRPEENPVVVQWLDGQPKRSVWTTATTILEVRYGLLILPAGRRRESLVARFDHVLDDSLEGRVLKFDRLSAERAAEISARRRTVGRTVDAHDTQIAGIVMSRNATLATRNVRDFDDLDMPLVNPWED